MMILLYGPNTYERDRKAQELISAARSKYSDASYEVISGDDENDIERTRDFLSETGLFSGGKKVLYLRGLLAISGATLLRQVRVSAARDDVLCIFSEDWQKQTLNDDIKEELRGVDYKAQYFAPYTASQATRILITEAEKRGAVLDSTAAQYIYEYAHTNMYEALEEVARLSLLSTSITTPLLRSLPEYADSMSVFEFARTITSSTSLRQRLIVWEHMQLQRIDPYMIFGYLAKMAKKKNLIDALARADILVKSGRLEITQALEEIVISG